MMHIGFLLIISFIMPCAHGMMGKPDFFESESSERKRQQKQIEEMTTTIRERIDNKLDLDAPMPYWHGQKPLHRAIYHDPSGKLALQLLKAGANPDVQDNYGRTPLHWTCENLSTINIEILLKHNASPNIPDKELTTALHLLCLNAPQIPETKIAIKLLLAHGANPLATDKKNETPLQKKDKKESRFQLRSLIMRIYNNKKTAYLLLLKGKDSQNSPLFARLPTDLKKSILDKLYKGWPVPQSSDPAQLLSFVKETKKTNKF